MAQTEIASKTPAAPDPPPPAKKNKGGRPPAGTDRIPRVLSFFDKVAEIPKEDWGPRARIKIYRTEPSIDRVSLGKKRYVRDSLAPIDEDAIKRATWGGSGSYRLYLTYKAPNEREGKELDSVEVDILDTEYPPRLEPGEWLDLPENAKWKWAKGLLETPPPAPQTSMSSIVEVMNATNEIRKTAIEEMRQSAPAPVTTDPVVGAMGIVEKILSIKADNPMVSVLEKMLLSSQEEARAQRDRVDKLLEKLAEKNNAEPKTDTATMIKGFIEGLKSLRADAAEILPGGGGRSRLGPWMEFFQPALPAVIDMLKPVAVAIARNSGQPNPAQPGQPGQPQIQQPPAVHQQQPDDFAVFLDRITGNMIYFLKEYDEPAPQFAMWLHDGFPEAPRAIEFIQTHGGVPALIGYYRTTKYWATLAPMEPEFTKFLAEVIAWKPSEDFVGREGDQPSEPDAAEAPVIDLETEEANA